MFVENYYRGSQLSDSDPNCNATLHRRRTRNKTESKVVGRSQLGEHECQVAALLACNDSPDTRAPDGPNAPSPTNSPQASSPGLTDSLFLIPASRGPLPSPLHSCFHVHALASHLPPHMTLNFRFSRPAAAVAVDSVLGSAGRGASEEVRFAGLC